MAVSSKRLKLCNFKLDVLLQITQAINENHSQGQLLERYEEILRDELNIGRIHIFKNNGGRWEQILDSLKGDVAVEVNVERELLDYDDISFVTNSPNPALEFIDIVIPIIYNDKPLAFVLIGDIDQDIEGISPTIKHLHFIQTLSNVILVAIENIRLNQENLRQESLRKELELASRMQTMLIPDPNVLPKNDFVQIVAFYSPHQEIGGDYYDFIQLDQDQIGFCIADVSGKGISAALLMSNFQANLRALFTPDIPLSSMIGVLNSRVISSTKGEKFITLFLARYNYRTHVLEYVNAGHNPPLFYETGNKQLQFFSKGCVGMGMLDEIPIVKRGEYVVNQHSKLLCYTDGLVELLDENGVEFGTREIENDLKNGLSIHDNIEDIIRNHRIREGSAKIFDDISILGLEFFV